MIVVVETMMCAVCCGEGGEGGRRESESVEGGSKGGSKKGKGVGGGGGGFEGQVVEGMGGRKGRHYLFVIPPSGRGNKVAMALPSAHRAGGTG